ncbi:DUF4192 domain-containing protein [Cryptosporangium sp. NPDC048952]|uniref:DUF4192 domain-containing protein n=1 Tax=Cryptosporangium sp. NPDC048952 TaxID=3363961 RepID=UPI00372451EA
MTTTQPTVRLTTPPEIVRAIPSLLGFHPRSSLVVLGLAGRRLRLRMTMRVDLPPPGLEAVVAEQVAARLSAEDVCACVVVLFTADFDVSQDVEPARARGHLPGAAAAYAAQKALRGAGLEVRELLRAESGRWWSYSCDGPCCPPDGLGVEEGPATLLDVLRVASGRPVFADRSQLVASVERDPDEPTEALLVAIREREYALAGVPPGRRAARDLTDLHTLLRRGSEVAPADSTPADSTPADSTPDDSARAYSDRTIAFVAVALTHLAVRDASFAWTSGPLADTAVSLWGQIVRRVPAPYAAGPATLLAVSAYRRGDGALADACLRRALDDDPDYRMAGLVLTSLKSGFRPTDVESALGLDGAGSGSARSAPSPDGGADAR